MIRTEDTDCNLCTLEHPPTSLMQYPKFGGAESQCHFKWEERMIRALKTNKAPAVDQVNKICEYLSGHPL